MSDPRGSVTPMLLHGRNNPATVDADRMSNMHYLKPVFLTTDPETDDVVKMSAMVSDYASALNRKDVLHVRLAGVTGPDVAKVAIMFDFSSLAKVAMVFESFFESCQGSQCL